MQMKKKKCNIYNILLPWLFEHSPMTLNHRYFTFALLIIIIKKKSKSKKEYNLNLYTILSQL